MSKEIKMLKKELSKEQALLDSLYKQYTEKKNLVESLEHTIAERELQEQVKKIKYDPFANDKKGEYPLMVEISTSENKVHVTNLILRAKEYGGNHVGSGGGSNSTLLDFKFKTNKKRYLFILEEILNKFASYRLSYQNYEELMGS